MPPAPGTVGSAAEAAGLDTKPTAPAGPVKTRETASDGYHRALAAHREAVPPPLMDPATAEATQRQTKAMRELSRRAFPEPKADPDDAPAPIKAVQAQHRRQAAATEAAALRRARAERAAQQAGTTPVVARTPLLRTTA
ncbi:hypothetical protein [Streptomyces sp. WZ-12]|uniref:hypothetical protein n=1 Tax=Streptomyces sp. WZ-12 TaxID=3030210 RepID=UPI002381169D|nr:hypothetical protein [Streptomyces sp. WZ-12]